MVLEWDPKKRGGKVAFEMLCGIMNKYIIQVFVINTLECYSYEITEDTKMFDLKLLINSNTQISCDNQCLILPDGVIAADNIGQQIIEKWYNANNATDMMPLTI